jgi:hypothetical protein
MRVTGGCHCGAIRFEAELEPRRVVACHCTDCQTMGGGAFRVLAPVPAASFRLVSGAPATYVKTADSGRRRAQGFCAQCGTHLYATDPPDAGALPSFYTVRVGALDQRGELAPSAEMWCDSRAPWLPAFPGTRCVARQ